MGNIEKFDSMANKYDTVERIKFAKIISDAIKENISNTKEKTAIDYGCGTGLVGMNLIDNFDSMLFIDASNNMVEVIKQKIAVARIKTADALCYDLMNEKPHNLHADYIIMSQTLLHIKEVELILSHLYSLLNDEGHLLIVDFDKNDAIISSEVHNGFDQEELINIVKKIGFLDAKAKTFYHGEKVFMNKDASYFILDAVK